MNDLELAFSTSDEAAKVALAHFTAGVAVSWKADGSPVTEADREVEHLLRDRLSAARPGDAFFGEELGELGESERVWIIDPIDGTRRFASGDPNWRVQFALEVNGVTELSVVTSPALGLRWWAVRGAGAFETSWPHPDPEPRRLQVSTTTKVAGALIDAVGDDVDLIPGARPAATPLPLIELVRGQIDAFLVERYSKWDHAPWILLAEEAGGRFTNPAGTNTGDQGGGLYSNANLHPALIAALNYPSA